MNLARLGCRETERLAAVGGFEDAVPVPGEDAPQRRADGGFVLDQHHHLACERTHHSASGAVPTSVLNVGGARQGECDVEARAGAFFGVHADLTTGLVHDRIGGREPEPSARALVLDAHPR